MDGTNVVQQDAARTQPDRQTAQRNTNRTTPPTHDTKHPDSATTEHLTHTHKHNPNLYITNNKNSPSQD